MFEIGNSLREARSRRGVDFPEAELATKIRAKYLRALEDERFELLPAQTYIKGFLRTYAEYLGLDGQLYVDEYNSRFVAGEESEFRPRRSTARPPRRNRRFETNVVLVSLAAIAVVTVVVIAAWDWAGSSSPKAAPGTKTTAPSTTVSRKQAKPPLLLITALRGATHITALNGGASGAVRYEGTLEKGSRPLAINGKRLWVQIDTPENLRLEVEGHVAHVPGHAPRVIIVTPLGWQQAS